MCKISQPFMPVNRASSAGGRVVRRVMNSTASAAAQGAHGASDQALWRNAVVMEQVVWRLDMQHAFSNEVVKTAWS